MPPQRSQQYYQRQQEAREFHAVVLGSGGVGKSCLTAQFVYNAWVESYDPTIEDSYRTSLQVDGRPVMLEILDTAGTDQFVAMRDLYMKAGHGFLLVFSITSPSSLAELEGLRDDILRIKNAADIPIVIVGNKADLEDQRRVSRTKAFNLSQEWGVPYYETSARNRTNVDEIFTDLCRQMMRRDDSYTKMLLEGDTPPKEASYGLRGWKKRNKRDSGKMQCVIL